MLCISVRQPWAWYIVEGIKDCENRTWPTRIKGNVLIHASRTLTKADYDACLAIAFKAGHFNPPPFDSLKRGGVIGMVELYGCTRSFNSPWAAGPFIHLFRNSYPLPFEPSIGQTGYYEYGSLPKDWKK